MDEHDQILDELQAKSMELGIPWDINKAIWEIDHEKADGGQRG